MHGAKCTGGGGFARVDVADDHDVDMSFFFTVMEIIVSQVLVKTLMILEILMHVVGYR